MKPHVFAQMVNEVRDLAQAYGSTEQFRDRVSEVLGKHVPMDHGEEVSQEPKKLDSCETCRFKRFDFLLFQEKGALCLRRAPTSDPRTPGHPLWPRIRWTDWCGDHEP